MNRYFKAARTRLHKYLVGELNCTLINKGERSWYYKSSSLDLIVRISDHLSTRDEDVFDIVFIKQSTSNILVHFRNSVSLVNSFAELKATIRAADSMAIGLRPMNSCKTELAILSQKIADLSEKMNSPTPDGFVDLSRLTKAQRNQVEGYLKQSTKNQ